MAWDGNGNYVLSPSYYPEVNGTVIDAVRYNGLMTDLQTALNNVVAKDGQVALEANLSAGGYKLTSLAAGTANGDAVRFEQVQRNGVATIASAATTDLGSSSAGMITISGTTTITSFGSSAETGQVKDVYFSGALTLTHHSTSLVLPSAANITTAAGDCATFVHSGSGNWRCVSYSRYSGNPLVVSFNAGDGTVSAPGFYFNSDTNTGFYRIGADSMGATAGGILAATFNHAAGGISLAPASSHSVLTLSATGGTSGNGTVTVNAAAGSGGSSGTVNLQVAGTTLVSLSGLTDVTRKVTLTGQILSSGVSCTATGGESGIGASISGNAGACTFTFGATPTTTITIGFGVTYSSVPVVIPSYEGQTLSIETIPSTTGVTFNLSAASAGGDKLRFITIE